MLEPRVVAHGGCEAGANGVDQMSVICETL
jgi:hypothetical protein